MTFITPRTNSPERAPAVFSYEQSGGFDLAPLTTDVFTHAFLEKLYAQCRELNELTGPAKTKLFDAEYEGVTDAITKAEGVVVAFGLGYPFYAEKTTQEGGKEILPVPEISRYITDSAQLISRDRRINLGAWACAVCQQERALPDLKTACKPCDLTDLKPREPFKVLPDLDMWVVVDEASDEVKQDIRSNLTQMGYHPSDEDIARSIRSTDAVLKKVLRYNGKLSLPNRTHLPVDIHIIDKSEFTDALHKFMRDPAAPAPIYPESLRVGWRKEVEAADFAFDFVFSLTELGAAEAGRLGTAQFLAELNHARKVFAQWLDNSDLDITSYLSARSERGRRILESPDLREIAEARMQSWRSEEYQV